MAENARSTRQVVHERPQFSRACLVRYEASKTFEIGGRSQPESLAQRGEGVGQDLGAK